VLTVVLCVTSLCVALLAARLMAYDVGTAAGLMAGAFTESTVIGTAGDAIRRLPLEEAEKAILLNRIPVAYAVSYLVGTMAVVWFLSSVGPRLLGVDLPQQARELQSSFEPSRGALGVSAFEEWDRRAFRVATGGLAGHTVRDIERRFETQRLFVEQIRRDGVVRAVGPDLQVREGDVIAMAGRRSALVAAASVLGTEVDDAPLLSRPLVTADVVVTRFTDRTLGEVGRQYGRGLILRSLVRGGQDIPFHEDTVINRGDLLRIAGNEFDVTRVGEAIGYV
jgi:putative transport protein